MNALLVIDMLKDFMEKGGAGIRTAYAPNLPLTSEMSRVNSHLSLMFTLFHK